MSLTYGFYDSLNGDRRYNALQMSRMFDGIINDGIFRFIGAAFEPLVIGGMNISIGTGRAWFNNTWTYNDALFPLEVEASDIILNRIDTVVIDVDSRSAHRKNNIIIVKGTPATTPVPAVLLDEDDHHQHALCYILVNKNATEIIQANITNLVGNPEHCPFVKLVAGDGITKSDEPPLGPIDLELWLDTTEDNYQASIFADMSSRIGDVSALTTEDKSSLVGAVNETVDNLNLVQPISGSNANGNYTKFPDGTMICTKRIVFPEGGLESSGLYFSASEPIANSFLFNTEINLAPSISVSGYSTQRTTTAGGTSSTTGAVIDSTNARWSVHFVTPPTSGGVIVTLTIIGRWKD